MAARPGKITKPTESSTQLLAQLPEQRTVEGTNAIALDVRPELFKALDPAADSVTGTRSWILDLAPLGQNVAIGEVNTSLQDRSLTNSITVAGSFLRESQWGTIFTVSTQYPGGGIAAASVWVSDHQLQFGLYFDLPNTEDRQMGPVRSDKVDLPANEWSRIGLVLHPGVAELYLNGAKVLELAYDEHEALGGFSFHDGAAIRLAGFPTMGELGSEILTFQGADLRSWNTALSPDAMLHDVRINAEPTASDVASLGGWRGGEHTAHWEQSIQPSLYLIEHYQMDIVPAATGLGKIAKTITLLPGETTTTFISSTREVAVSSEARQSVLDSSSESTQRSFDSEVRSSHQSERSVNTASSIASSTSVEVEASASGSWGLSSASVSSKMSASVDTSSSVARSRKDVSNSVRGTVARTARSANSRRDLQIDTTERTQTTERDVESIERRFHNPSGSRTMTAVFRQINQRYVSLLQLVDVRVGYSEGAGIAIESSMANLDHVLDQVLVAEDGGTSPRDELRSYLLDAYADFDPITSPAGVTAVNTPGTPLLTAADGGLATRAGSHGTATIETGTTIELSGVLVDAFSTVMRTDNVAAESVLGESEVFDPHARDVRAEQLKQLRLQNQLLKARLDATKRADLPVEAVVDLLTNGPEEDAIIALDLLET